MPSIWILLSLIIVTIIVSFSDIIHELPEIQKLLGKDKLKHHYYGEEDRWKED